MHCHSKKKCYWSLEGRKWSVRVQEVKKGFPKTMVFIWSMKDDRACHDSKTQETILFSFSSPIYSPLCYYLFWCPNRVRLPFFLKSPNSFYYSWYGVETQRICDLDPPSLLWPHLSFLSSTEFHLVSPKYHANAFLGLFTYSSSCLDYCFLLLPSWLQLIFQDSTSMSLPWETFPVNAVAFFAAPPPPHNTLYFPGNNT